MRIRWIKYVWFSFFGLKHGRWTCQVDLPGFKQTDCAAKMAISNLQVQGTSFTDCLTRRDKKWEVPKRSNNETFLFIKFFLHLGKIYPEKKLVLCEIEYEIYTWYIEYLVWWKKLRTICIFLLLNTSVFDSCYRTEVFNSCWRILLTIHLLFLSNWRPAVLQQSSIICSSPKSSESNSHLAMVPCITVSAPAPLQHLPVIVFKSSWFFSPVQWITFVEKTGPGKVTKAKTRHIPKKIKEFMACRKIRFNCMLWFV